jgi:glycerophosphoryl diester phosphodiesterase
MDRAGGLIPTKIFGHGTEEDINTLPSFDRVRASGADGVELDVRRTVDDQLAVMHDPIDLLMPGVPILAEALDACRGLTVNIEIKNFPRDPQFDPSQRVTDLVLDLLEERSWSDDVLISCFDGACLHHVSARRPDVRVGLLMLSRRPGAELLERAAGEGFRIVHPYDTMVDASFMDQARSRGIAVNVWMGEDESAERFRALARVGADGVITSVPNVAATSLSSADS